VNSGGDFSVATNKFTVASATGNTAVAGTLGATGDFAVNTNKFTVTAASGNTAVAGTLASTGNFAVNTDKFSVTAASGNTSVAGTLGAAGNFAVNTDKFTVAASSGNTAVAGTFGVTGVTTLTGALVANGNSTLGDADTDTVTLNASFVTGTTLKTAKSDTNTLALAAYDVDGTAYTNLVTLTAGNTPSLALTSTAVGTINNMSIGATTASTGAFTTLSASSDVTLSGGTANGVLYLNGSKVATSGSALVFDGSNLGVGASATALSTYRGAEFAGTTATTGGFLRMRTSDSSVNSLDFLDVNGRAIFTTTNHPMRFGVNDTEQMRLTSTGLGIGTSSITSGFKLDVQAARALSLLKSTTGTNDVFQRLNNTGGNLTLGIDDSAGSNQTGSAYASYLWSTANSPMIFATNNGERMRLDTSGNLGLGVTPSAWNSGFKAFQVGQRGSLWSSTGSSSTFVSNNTLYDSGGFKYIQTGTATAYEQGAGAHIWYQAASGTGSAALTLTQAMTLDASGNFVVGRTAIVGGVRTEFSKNANANYNTTFTTATSSAQLALTDFSDVGTYATPASTLLFGAGSSGTAWSTISGIRESSQNSALTFSTASGGSNPVERARIDSSGNLCVGTTSAGGAGGFSVSPNASVGAASVYFNRATSTSNSFVLDFRNAASTVGYIAYNNTTVTYATSSDYRLKNTIAPMTGALAKVALLKPCTYKWNVDGSDGEGFIAHELAEVMPNAVTGDKDAVDAEGNPKYQGIDTSFLVATLTAAIQELKAEFDAYKASHP
jgi:hypothetical protein